MADFLLMADDVRKFDDDPGRCRRPVPFSGAASRYFAGLTTVKYLRRGWN
jgi:hypothetical protein